MSIPDKPTLPTPDRARWQPLRLGLVELFHYDSEEFWFRDGHLLLRGNNGTGKSKVLSLTLPTNSKCAMSARMRSMRRQRGVKTPIRAWSSKAVLHCRHGRPISMDCNNCVSKAIRRYLMRWPLGL
jgi:hypothetical protein